ncbi:MAG: hypothetical protein QGI60_05335 [archaeon]|jgi:hypothetical protein|nr:hypothetical protein [archaeon]
MPKRRRTDNFGIARGRRGQRDRELAGRKEDHKIAVGKIQKLDRQINALKSKRTAKNRVQTGVQIDKLVLQIDEIKADAGLA